MYITQWMEKEEENKKKKDVLYGFRNVFHSVWQHPVEFHVIFVPRKYYVQKQCSRNYRILLCLNQQLPTGWWPLDSQTKPDKMVAFGSRSDSMHTMLACFNISIHNPVKHFETHTYWFHFDGYMCVCVCLSVFQLNY